MVGKFEQQSARLSIHFVIRIHYILARMINTMKKTASLSTTIYLPGLNGLRAIAAIAVVLSHTTLGLGEFGLNPNILGTDAQGNAKGLSLANNGVTIFFTLSGFLITYLLLREKELHPLRVRDFYVRRVLRIWPLYYLYLGAAIITVLHFGLPYDGKSLPFYLLLAANIPFIIGNTFPFVAHYWSLGVEEQFYLFFPQLARLSNQKLLRVSVFLIFGLLLLKGVFGVLGKKYGISIPYLAITVTRFHVMLIGVVGAILYYYNNSIFMTIATHKLTQLLSWFCMLLIALNYFRIGFVDAELVSVIALFLIVGQVTKKGLINLENKICDFVGKISYGVYVIHPLLIFLLAKTIGGLPDTFSSYLLVYTMIMAATLVVAYLSYQYYEKPFLRLKAKFTTVKSSNTKSVVQERVI